MNSTKNNFLLLVYLLTGLYALSWAMGSTFSGSWQLAGIINERGETVEKRINLPAGFVRLPVQDGSFGNYLRTLPVKPHGSKVLLFSGKQKWNQSAHIAVIAMEIGSKDLQQCADAVIRLRAEYLSLKKEYDSIHFNFTSGHRCDFSKWAEGYRPVVNGNKVSFVKKAAKDYSYTGFRNYLDVVFTYAGSLSLSKELKPVKNINDILPGDVFIKGGSPGHAAIVMDVAVNKSTGKKIFLQAQSYMPAQETHLLRNPTDDKFSPWYSVDFGETLDTPEWSFGKGELMRF